MTTIGEVQCQRCGHGYRDHEDGGRCLEGWLTRIFGCWCEGFLWVPPDGPPVGSYSDRPRPV